MDDFDNDRDSNASSDEQQDDAMTMEDADEMEVEEDDQFNEEEEDTYDNEQEQDGDAENDNEQEQDQDQDGGAEGDEDNTTRVEAPSKSTSALQSPTTPKFRPQVRPEALSARLYDIVPTMAAPQATSINALAITPDLRYWMTGGSDGYVRKYDGPGTINGKQLLTVAQRHPFVDSVTKAGILMSYWENFEPLADKGRTGVSDEDKVLSPVYSLAVHSEALWSLAGLESGGINLHSVRYDEGKVIHTLPSQSADHEGHANAVSVLQLTPSETSVLSGSWDKRIFDWDLNTGNISAKFDGSGGQISAIELRPLNGAPIPAEAAEEPAWGDTFRTQNSRTNGFFTNGLDNTASAAGADNGAAAAPGADGVGDRDAGSDHESLFGSPAGSLFGEGQMGEMGGGTGGAFGGDDDNEFSHAMLEPLEDAPPETLGDTAMADAPDPTTTNAEPAAAASSAAASHPTVKSEQGLGEESFTLETANSGAHSASDPAQPDPSQQLQADAAAAQAQQAQQQQQPPPQPQIKQQSPPPHNNNLSSPSLVFNPPPPPQHDPSQTSDSVFLAASMNGTIRIWDRRMATPLARISTRPGVPPWCMGACWSPDGNMIHVGRRNGTVEEFSLHHARGGYPGWQPERSLRFPAGSGAVSAVRPMPNGRHLVCASHDILRLYDLKEQAAFKHGAVPFLIIPGPPRAGVISQLYIDPSGRFMITAAGTRGWDGSSTEVLIGYEIASLND